jgi:hypothetical protein
MFIPRHPVVENQFCQFWGQTTVSGGAGDVLAYAGSVCYLDTSATDATVKIYAANENYSPFGFLMQKVKTGYHSVHPAAFMMPGDLGSSDVIAQPSYDSNGAIDGSKPAPVGVAHLGIWDTIHYYHSAAINAGVGLGIRASSMSEISVANRNSNQTQDIAMTVKGASAAQVTANVNNTTLYPIRVKILI